MVVKMIDLSSWLNPLDGENPSGESLRNNRDFHELERLMQPQVEVMRDERNNPSSQVEIPVDWSAVLEKAEELRPQGRDLRLLVSVTRALTNLDGFAGLAEGLTLIARTFDAHWDTMHPELRPDAPARDAALRRINALMQLQSHQDGPLGDLRRMTIFEPRGIDPVKGEHLEKGGLDVRSMLNEAKAGLSEAEKARLSAEHEQLVDRVRKACLTQIDNAPSEMTKLLASVQEAAAALNAAEAALNAHLGDASVTISDLKRFLERVLATLERWSSDKAATANGASRKTEAPIEPSQPAVNGHDAQAATTFNGTASTGTMGAFPDRLTSREDVLKCLDLIVAFYDRTEPSSPIPHLARRIRRMVPMDFVELMEDLAPSGLKEFRLLAGATDDSKTAHKDER
jgi:type VI secretion system protein ImpA